MDVEHIRLVRLRQHAQQLGGQHKLAEKLEKSDSQMSQLIGENPSRNVGRKLARQFERKLGMEEFELDQPLPKTAGPGRVPTIKEELIFELVMHHLDTEQQNELLKVLRAAKDSRLFVEKLTGYRLKHIGNERMEDKFGFPNQQHTQHKHTHKPHK